MSLAHPPPQDPPAPAPRPSPLQQYARAQYAAAAVAVVAFPIIAILPPRKLDLYTIALLGGTAFSANHLVRESTGVSIWQSVTGDGKRSVAQAAGRNEVLEPSPPVSSNSVVAELQRQNRGAPQRELWKVQREKEIQEEIEEGKGFGDMIVDQVWEVWNWGKKADDEDED